MSGSLQFDQVSKQFPGVRALDGVSFEAHAGAVHGLWIGPGLVGAGSLVATTIGIGMAQLAVILIAGSTVELAIRITAS